MTSESFFTLPASPANSADISFGAHPVHSRAYVLMPDVASIVAFHTAFDGHLFRSKTGKLRLNDCS